MPARQAARGRPPWARSATQARDLAGRSLRGSASPETVATTAGVGLVAPAIARGAAALGRGAAAVRGALPAPRPAETGARGRAGRTCARIRRPAQHRRSGGRAGRWHAQAAFALYPAHRRAPLAGEYQPAYPRRRVALAWRPPAAGLLRPRAPLAEGIAPEGGFGSATAAPNAAAPPSAAPVTGA